MDSTRSAILHLSLIPHVGSLTIQKIEVLLAQRGVELGWLYGAGVNDLEACGLSSAQAQQVAVGLRDVKLLEEELALIAKYNVQVVFRKDDGYPALLRSIYAPPSLLYVQGSCEALVHERLTAIVGSRNATSYGRSVVDQFVPTAITRGWGVVSGGARGIDAYAHRAALSHRGSTIAVLGSGLLKPYPAEHRSLFADIAAQGGAVISPFPLCMAAAPGNFPARNRIIAGIASSCIIVQAAEKSGALITAKYALSEGRDVAVVPGSIFEPLSAGCHGLLRDGATPLTSCDEFMTFLGSDVVLDDNSARSRVVQEEHPLLVACQETPRHFEELLSYTGGAPDELYSQLWELQISGKVTQTITGLWQRC